MGREKGKGAALRAAQLNDQQHGAGTHSHIVLGLGSFISASRVSLSQLMPVEVFHQSV